eukprot:TRINITY_DN116651_c0_g1_i1.p3 TRINITY_DN116651_c0_g1~~TRINITY_DN116651_c0_g1_i1.p3  ORF type:complete len:107 (+),score=9.49 TRINITY_DN116651_c0_g1_i1:56-376(+)
MWHLVFTKEAEVCHHVICVITTQAKLKTHKRLFARTIHTCAFREICSRCAATHFIDAWPCRKIGISRAASVTKPARQDLKIARLLARAPDLLASGAQETNLPRSLQ